MLGLLRKHQRYLFIFITIVVIISFSFFGTYSTMISNYTPEPIAFQAVDGADVKRADLDEMVLFLSTDGQDKLLLGGLWGPNFLNDGVVKKDFLETGLANILAAQYFPDLEQDLAIRHEKEKRNILYVHPQAKFLSVETAWSYLAPGMKQNYESLRNAKSPASPEGFLPRVQLYLNQREFPAPSLQYVLRYQEKQYTWLAPDPNLERADLSLFGYHTLEDWFGPRFIRVIAQFIINSAKIAEQQGYEVTKAEALADLMANAQASYTQNLKNPYLGVANSTQYFEEQLRRLSMDQTKAAKVWRQVLLFRRLFHDAGNSVVVDPLTVRNFQNYAKETVEGEVYHLPKPLQLNNFHALQTFETYLNAVSKRSDDQAEILNLPTQFLAADEVMKTHPELVQKRYLLEYAHINKKDLQTKVGIRDTWNWEVEDAHWSQLKKQFPELGIKKGDTREERFAALDSLDEKTRARVDAYARNQIVDENPEWLDKALQAAQSLQEIVGLTVKGGTSPFEGIQDRTELLALLDKASIGEQDPALAKYTGDKANYYKIIVLEKGNQQEVLSYAEADASGVLNPILEKELETFYGQAREASPADYQKADKSWKPLAEVRNEIAEKYFEKLLLAIRNDYNRAAETGREQQTQIPDISASLRFYSYARGIKEQLKTNPELAEQITVKSEEIQTDGKLPERLPLDSQWKFIQGAYASDRGAGADPSMSEDLFSLEEGSWSETARPVNGDLHFIHIVKKANEPDPADLKKQVFAVHEMMSDEAQRVLMTRLVGKMKEKNAISLEYMNSSIPEMIPEESLPIEQG
jgi:GcvH upstream region-like protein